MPAVMTASGIAWHKQRHCEIEGCTRHFSVLLGGRHHCRECGISVCHDHFCRPLCVNCLPEPEQPLRSQGPSTVSFGSLNKAQAVNTDDSQAVLSPSSSVPRGDEDVELCKDVYATAFVLANNATPAMYSFAPWRNSDMYMVWFYLVFIAFSQSFVLVALMFINPPSVDSRRLFVNCNEPTAEAKGFLEEESGSSDVVKNIATVAASLIPSVAPDWASDWASYFAGLVTSLTESKITAGSATASVETYGLSAAALARCLELEVAFPADVAGKPVQYRSLEHDTPFYENIFGVGDVRIYVLQVVCCVWVTVQVYFTDFKNVAALLEYRDFNRWLLPLKGEELRNNSWVLLIPLLQYMLAVGVVAVSCCVTCGYVNAFDIVLNSLAFTFISQIAELFNEPLLRFYAAKAISGLDPQEYGTDPIYYIVHEYSESNVDADGEWANSWYVKEEDKFAGLLTDFTFRHSPEDYKRPNRVNIIILRIFFFIAPVAATTGCWFFFTRCT